VDSDVEVVFARNVPEECFLVEYVAMVGRWLGFTGDKGALVLKFHAAGELDLHFDGEDGEVVLVALGVGEHWYLNTQIKYEASVGESVTWLSKQIRDDMEVFRKAVCFHQWST